MIQSQQFRAVQRPKDLCSPYELVVVDGSGVPHLPLTVFYHETQRFLAERTAKTYLATLLPYFNYLVTDPWRREREDRWDSLPDAVRESVRDFLVEQLHYKAQPRDTDQLVRRTCKSPSTVHVFLCALKQFYHLARRKEWYPYPHPLTDPTAKLLQDVEAEERREAGHRPRMPQRSGVEAGTATLPVSFSYEEPRYKQRFHFLLWDRPSFVLAHADSYSKTLCSTARNKRLQYSPERNHFFLEFVGAESLIDPNAPREPDALFWFGELLRSSLIGERANCGTPEEIERKQAFLRSWGYGEREAEEFATQPFSTGQTGLLTETRIGGQANFLTAARRKTSGLLFTIETLYDAATFGLAALDFFTTTGARANELLQLRLSPDCLYAMKVGGTPRLLVRLVPKGRDQPADYMIGPETKRNLERVGAMLKDHYQLGPGESLPHVPFNPDNQRAHRFPGKHPYLFQYHGKQLLRSAVTASLRFLCHGMVFQRADGTTVILKPHLLRHVFANHLHQVEHVPLDLVAVILHQKDTRVTGYYAAPTWQQVVETTGSFLDRCATQLGEVEEAFVRAPAELQRQWEEARNQVGTLAKVPGGDCTCHAVCPYSYVCTGCVYKIPDPARREEIVEQKQWALIRYEQVKRRSMGPETVKMQALIQRCDTELEEMNLIEEYRADETYQPDLRIESGKVFGKHGAPLAPKTLPTEARAHRAPGQGDR